MIRSLPVFFFPVLILLSLSCSRPPDEPFVYDMIEHLEDAEEFQCPVLSLCEVKALNDWTGPEKVPEKDCIRYSTTIYFPPEPSAAEVELWQENERIPVFGSPELASILPFWTIDYQTPLHLPVVERFDTKRSVSVAAEPLAGTAQVEIAAFGTPGAGHWPIMGITVDGFQRQQQVVNSTRERFYRYLVGFEGKQHEIQISFVNVIETQSDGNRNLYVNGGRIVPKSTIQLYVEEDTPPPTEKVTLQYLPEHIGYALMDHPESLFQLRPQNQAHRRNILEPEICAEKETRNSLFVPGPARIAYSLPLPADATLEFAVTVATGHSSNPMWGHGTVRWLWKPETGKPTVLFERFFDPQHRPQERRWIPFQVDLRMHGGEKGLLVLETDNGFPPGSEGGTAYEENEMQGIRVAHPRVFTVPARARTPRTSDPDVILISIDTLRADHLGCYGYFRNTTPHLDKLAAEAVLFENAHSPASWTLPAHVSLFTSLYPSTHAVIRKFGRIPGQPLQLGEWFRHRGYRTGAFVDGGYLKQIFGYARGFDVYQDRYAGIAKILPKAEKWWKSQPSGHPRMMFIHFYDVHGPYGNAEEYRSRFHEMPHYHRLPYIIDPAGDFKRELDAGNIVLIDQDIEHMVSLYDGDLYYSDEKLGEFFDDLRQRNEWDSAVVIVLSDHGEEFLEHGSVNHGHSVYNELIHVPLIVKFPGKRWAGVRISQPVSLVDVLPTLADFLAGDPGPRWQGRSFIPLITESDTKQEEPVYAETPDEFKAITSEYRLIIPVGGRPPTQRPRLYDARFDPTEQFDMYAVAGDWAVRGATAAYQAHARLLDASAGVEEARIDARLAQELEALGYVR